MNERKPQAQCNVRDATVKERSLRLRARVITVRYTVPQSMDDPSNKKLLSVIIPAYNEAQRIGRALDALQHFHSSTRRPMEVIVVIDGGSDDTPAIVNAFKPDGFDLRLIANDRNRGKGYSVRCGMLEARGDLMLMTDADLSTPLEELSKLEAAMALGNDVVIGSRAMPESELDPPQPPLRRTMDVVFRVLRRMVMLPDIRDTQCGFKLFSRPAARDVFTALQTNGFAFDCEALALAREMNYAIAEVGVVWRNDRRSTIRPVRDAVAMFISLLRIRRRLGRKLNAETAKSAEKRQRTKAEIV